VNVNNGDYRAAGITIELRDNGQFGLLLPPDQVSSVLHSTNAIYCAQIFPNGEEIIPAVMYYANNLLENPLKKE